MKAKTNAALGRSVAGANLITAYSPIDRVNEIQRATECLRIITTRLAVSQAIYVPNSFGESRMASMGWLLKFENSAGTGDEYIAAVKKQASEKSASGKVRMDWIYLCSLRQDGKSELFEAAREMAKSGGREEQSFFLASLPLRTESPDQQNYYDNSTRKQDSTPPLAADDIELMLKCVRSVSEPDQSPNSMQGYRRTTYIAAVGKELKRANRDTTTLIDEFAG